MKKIVVAFLALLFGCANFYAQVGTLDLSFGNGGIATSPFMSNGDDVAKDVKIQTDGKILVGGISSGGLTNDFVIARYLINGDLDQTFGNGGFVKTDINGDDDQLNRIYIQDDGKILAIGGGKLGLQYNGIVIRYNSDGTIDNSFGVNGIFRLIHTDDNSDYFFHGIDVKDGSIYISGHYIYRFQLYAYQLAMTCKLNFSGSLDTSYNITSNGWSATDCPAYSYDLKVLSNSLIQTYYVKNMDETAVYKARDLSGVLLGSYTTSSTRITNSIGIQSNGKLIFGKDSFKTIRFNSNNVIDVTYGINGFATPTLTNSVMQNRTIVLPNDKILSVGWTSTNSYIESKNDIIIVKQNADGSMDTSFDTDGILSLDVNGNADIAYSAIGIDNGQILVVGYATNMSDKDFIILKYNADGTLDSSFGNNGTVISDFSESIDSGIQHVVLNNGKIVVAVQSSHKNFNLIGFNPDGTLDTTFGTNGKVSTTISTINNDNISVLLLDQNQKIWAFSHFGVARYNTDGSLDVTFGNNGIFSSVFEVDYAKMKNAAVQNDGKFIIGISDSSSSAYLKRFNANCSVDTSFGNNGKAVFPNITNNYITSLKVLSDNSIIVSAGNRVYNLNSNGVFNNSFGGGLGYALGDTYDKINFNLDVFPNGKIITHRYLIIRKYLNNGLLDPSFSEDGQVEVNFQDFSIFAQPDNKVILTYKKGLDGDFNFVITRLNEDGSTDTTFGTNGSTEVDYGGKNNYGSFVSLYDDKILVTGTLIKSNNQDVALYRFNNDYVVGVSDLLKESTKVFPNPFTDYLNIESDMGAIDTVTIYDTKGSLCGTYNTNQIDLSHLKAGMYFVKITQNDKSFVAKVFKN
ncbi:MAG: T9SS type A sorting domain-containing protein [Saprospiraceae bacterium]|nr:T9SS type A sorting domain-containing protein [Saprospiraceae bacterium]